MKLFALSDLHVGYAENRWAIARMTPRPDDWLILAGDLGETEEHLLYVLDTLGPRFKQLVWVPGNHELYALPRERGVPRGRDRYDRLVALCRSRGVITPEDPYVLWEGEGGPHVLAPLFLLYDYSFRPAGVPEGGAVAWAMESGVLCTDEELLDPSPYESRPAWCRARLAETEARLAAIQEHPTVLINHFPLREELVRLWRIPRFSIWCGTRRTHDWHTRFRARVVVSGHLHIPRTDWIDGVRFEEVSFGYPRQRPGHRTVDSCVREILPGPVRSASLGA
ncbi:metallophosphoesterase [Sorangium sp. So ce1036]|uniref:metallophosphoesterase family protein n=1 Tax=Sorangium sp. So ce1036 TaxID=3133328 RepID=UPI003F07A30E